MRAEPYLFVDLLDYEKDDVFENSDGSIVVQKHEIPKWTFLNPSILSWENCIGFDGRPIEYWDYSCSKEESANEYALMCTKL